MLNPENRPTVRILPDGRKVATIKGLRYTEEELAERSRILTGKTHSREATLKKSIVCNLVKPLYLRGGLVIEISWITGLDKFQIRRAINRDKRPKWHSVTPVAYDGENKSSVERQIETKKLMCIPKTLSDGHGILFARKILNEGLILSEDSSWKGLLDLYKKHGRPLPPRLYDRLRLEVFLRARLNADNGSKELMDKYVEWGLGIDKDWFNELAVEEEFIIREIDGEKRGGKRDELFLNEFLRIRKEYAETGDYRVLGGVAPFLKQDPTVAERLAPQMAEIIKATPSKVINNNHKIPVVIYGEISWDDAMGR